MPLRVWAQAPLSDYLRACGDARMSQPGRGGRADVLWRRGMGAPGWDWGINFATLADLAAQLSAGPAPGRSGGATAGEVERLALFAHGGPGYLTVHGVGNEPYLSAEHFATYEGSLLALAPFLAADATVLLMGCVCGSEERGTRLLELLSGGRCWPGRTVVAFQHTGITFDQVRTDEHCSNPGMRVTPFPELTVGGTENRDLRGAYAWEWASERAASAKVARNGAVQNHMLDHGGVTSDLIAATSDADGWGRSPHEGFFDLPNLPPLPHARRAHPGRGRFRHPGRR